MGYYMNTDDFEIGDVLILVRNASMNAPIGQLCQVYKLEEDYVSVKWLDLPRGCHQGNGGYYYKQFEKYHETIQYEFDFMR